MDFFHPVFGRIGASCSGQKIRSVFVALQKYFVWLKNASVLPRKALPEVRSAQSWG